MGSISHKKRTFRWWKTEPDKLTKLKEAFLMDCTDKEACIYAGITERQLYYFQEKNPDFVSEKALFKSNAVLKARKAIFDNLDKPKVAMWYLESKCRKEFGETEPNEAEAEAEPFHFGEEAKTRLKKYIQPENHAV